VTSLAAVFDFLLFLIRVFFLPRVCLKLRSLGHLLFPQGDISRALSLCILLDAVVMLPCLLEDFRPLHRARRSITEFHSAEGPFFFPITFLVEGPPFFTFLSASCLYASINYSPGSAAFVTFSFRVFLAELLTIVTSPELPRARRAVPLFFSWGPSSESRFTLQPPVEPVQSSLFSFLSTSLFLSFYCWGFQCLRRESVHLVGCFVTRPSFCLLFETSLCWRVLLHLTFHFFCGVQPLMFFFCLRRSRPFPPPFSLYSPSFACCVARGCPPFSVLYASQPSTSA